MGLGANIAHYITGKHCRKWSET